MVHARADTSGLDQTYGTHPTPLRVSWLGAWRGRGVMLSHHQRRANHARGLARASDGYHMFNPNH